jgi:hypothetical protein
MPLRDWVSKGRKLFVQMPGEEAEGDKTAQEMAEIEKQIAAIGCPASAARTKAVPLEEAWQHPSGPEAPRVVTPSPALQEGPLDFEVLFMQAGVRTVDFPAEKVLTDVLPALPESLSRAEKRPIAETMLRFAGASAAAVMTDAQAKLEALEAFLDVEEKALADLRQSTQTEIARLQQEIAALERTVAEQEARYREHERLCEEKGETLNSVLEFLSAEEPPAEGVPELAALKRSREETQERS